MTDEEKNALIAEKLFDFKWWRSSSSGNRGLFAPDKMPEWFKERADMTEELCHQWNWQVPKFCTNYQAIEDARIKIVEKGLQSQMLEKLMVKLPFSDDFHRAFEIETYRMDLPDLFIVLSATPQQQADAIVEVLLEIK